MSELVAILQLVVIAGGMLGAFYLGAKKKEDTLFEHKADPEEMDVPKEPTEEEYNAWMLNNGRESEEEAAGN